MFPETMNKPTDNDRRAGSSLVVNEADPEKSILNPHAIATRKTLMMGSILVANGKLRQDQIDLILNEQRLTGLRFGETAIRMRLVSHADVDEALALQFGYSSSRATALALPDTVTSAVNPYSPFAEALRGLRSQLMTRW